MKKDDEINLTDSILKLMFQFSHYLNPFRVSIPLYSGPFVHPKNTSGIDMMIDAPSPVDQDQLNELYLELKPIDKEES